MDFANLTPAETDALSGPEREAWYAWRKGDVERANAILNTYGIVTAAAPKSRTRRSSTED